MKVSVDKEADAVCMRLSDSRIQVQSPEKTMAGGAGRISARHHDSEQ